MMIKLNREGSVFFVYMTDIQKTDFSSAAFRPDWKRPFDLLKYLPAYDETPLYSLSLSDGPVIQIKDERGRMGMGAFKAVGGIYAVARLIQEQWFQKSGQPLTMDELFSDQVREFASELVFVCASAGNHGMAVATGASLFGARSRIHLSETVPDIFEERLLKVGANVVRSGALYDDSVEAALEDAEKNRAILLADGSWPGYTHPPSLVMEGYTVIGIELSHQLVRERFWPSHVFLQAGVGGLAAAISMIIRETWAKQPEIIVVEPDAAPCLKESAEQNRLTTVQGPQSNMGRLDCKVPSLLAVEALGRCDVQYMLISDQEADEAVKDLNGRGIETTPSGAAGYAAVRRFSSSNITGLFNPLVIITEGG